MNTSDFIDAVKRAISVPTYQGRYSPDDFLALANEEQQITVLPMLTSVRENYNVTTSNIPSIAGTGSYRIPRRAVARAVREIWYQDGPSNESTYNLAQLNLEDGFQYQNGTGAPSYFSLEGDKIKLFPAPSQDGVLIVKYVIQLAKLVKTSRTAVITSLTDSTVSSTIALPANITISAGSNLVDITSYQPGYQISVADVLVTNIANGLTLTLDGFSPTVTLASQDVVQFDVVSTAGETSIIQLPDELHPVLVHATSVRILQGLSQPDRLKQEQEQLTKSVAAANSLLQPRSEGESYKVFQKNGLLRGRFSARFPRTQI